MESAGKFARSSNWLALLISIASVAGIVLALLGYGVAIAVQSKFGVPHSMTFSSSLELFNLGCWAVAQVLTSINEGSAWLKAVREIWSSSWPLTCAVVGLLWLGAILLWLAIAILRKLKSWMEKPVAKLTGGRSVIDILREHRFAGKIAGGMLISISMIIGTPFLMAFGL